MKNGILGLKLGKSLMWASMLIFSAAGVAIAQEGEVKELSIENIVHGRHWSGAEVKMDELKGKVVLLKIWGG